MDEEQEFLKSSINRQALGVCIDRAKQLIEEYNLEYSVELGEAMTKMFQEGIAFAYQAVMKEEI